MLKVPMIVVACAFGAGDSSPIDQDFVLQGEYAGSLQSAGNCAAPIGLQVVALGDGKFQAVEYAGGLPGNHCDKRSRRMLTGEKSTGGVTLTGDDRRIEIRHGRATVADALGRRLGMLEKCQRTSQTIRAPAPPEATVLFDGFGNCRWTNDRTTADHLLMVGADTRDAYRDFTMHLEFRTPYMPKARGQGRGNSGIYIQGRYEVQILDSFGLEGLNNECGGLYKAQAPAINMCFPPLAWQTYDIDFIAPRFDNAGKKTSPARITVRHNGIVIHKDYEIPDKTGGGAPEGPDARPIRFQDHGNPVHFRNVWIVERNESAGQCR